MSVRGGAGGGNDERDDDGTAPSRVATPGTVLSAATRPGSVMRPSSTSRSMCTLCGRSGGFKASIQSIAASSPGEQSRAPATARRGWSSCSARDAAAIGVSPVIKKYIVPPSAYRSVQGPWRIALPSAYCSSGA